MCVVANSVEAQTILLVPDSENQRVSAFDAFDGSIIDLNFIPDDGAQGGTSTLDSPFNAIGSGRGTIFVSDEDADSIFEYGFDGNLIGTFAGPNEDIGGVRGIAINGDSLFVNSTQGDDKVEQFNIVTGEQSTWTTSELASQQDILFRENDVLISNFFSDNIERYDLDGNFLSTFVDGDTNGIDFPQQIHEASNGDIIVAGLSSPAGLYRYDSNGELLEFYDVGSVRGVYELGNGNILYSSLVSGIVSLDLTSGDSTQIVNEGSYRYIEAVTVAVPEPSGFLVIMMAFSGMFLRRKSKVGR